jgi:hypothetical protein
MPIDLSAEKALPEEDYTLPPKKPVKKGPPNVWGGKC